MEERISDLIEHAIQERVNRGERTFLRVDLMRDVYSHLRHGSTDSTEASASREFTRLVKRRALARMAVGPGTTRYRILGGWQDLREHSSIVWHAHVLDHAGEAVRDRSVGKASFPDGREVSSEDGSRKVRVLAVYLRPGPRGSGPRPPPTEVTHLMAALSRTLKRDADGSLADRLLSSLVGEILLRHPGVVFATSLDLQGERGGRPNWSLPDWKRGDVAKVPPTGLVRPRNKARRVQTKKG